MDVNNVLVEKDAIDELITEDVIIENMMSIADVAFLDDVMSVGDILVDDNLKANSKTITTKERKQRIARLKAEIKKEEALLKQNLKKERTNQLVIFGTLVEEIFKTCSEVDRNRWIETTKEYLEGESCRRALAGFERLKKYSTKNQRNF